MGSKGHHKKLQKQMKKRRKQRGTRNYLALKATSMPSAYYKHRNEPKGGSQDKRKLLEEE